MRDRLTAVAANVGNQAKPVAQLLDLGDPLGPVEQGGHQGRILQLYQRIHVNARDHEHVTRRLGGQVADGDHGLVLVNDRGGGSAGGDLAENAGNAARLALLCPRTKRAPGGI